MTTRRELITLLGGAATWPVAARAQQGKLPRIGVLLSSQENDPNTRRHLAAFISGLQQLGWSDGRSADVHVRWGAGSTEQLRRLASELVALAPAVILASGGVSMQALLQETRTVPIVFTQVLDPVGVGYVTSLAHPGGNVTGFTNFDYATSAKWVEVLKQIAPDVKRAGVLRDTAAISGVGQMAALQAIAPALGVEIVPLGVTDASEIDRTVSTFGREPNGGLVVTAGALAGVHIDLIISVAARNRLPAVYPYEYFVAAGGLLSYGPDPTDQFRRAAGYVDRILKGEKPADLPVQTPTRYKLVVNLKTARALGLAVPAMLLARADEVVE